MMNLFLHGPIGVGKSTLLQEVMTPVVSSVCGMFTQRIQASGKTLGYRAALINGAFLPVETVFSPDLDGVFLMDGQRFAEKLDDLILQVERLIQSVGIRLVLLDEIGGIELMSGVFWDALSRILVSGKPCVGVYKSVDNIRHMASVLNLGTEYLERHEEMRQLICGNGTLIELTENNRESVRSDLAHRIRYLIKN